MVPTFTQVTVQFDRTKAPCEAYMVSIPAGQPFAGLKTQYGESPTDACQKLERWFRNELKREVKLGITKRIGYEHQTSPETRIKLDAAMQIEADKVRRRLQSDEIFYVED